MSNKSLPRVEVIRNNFVKLTFGKLTVWFSYTTPVAFHVEGQPLVVRQNDWSNTTGKHMAEIDGGGKEAKQTRVSGEEFMTRWAMMADRIAEGGINLLS